MKKVFILFSIFNIFLLQAQDKVVTKNGKEVEVNKDASATEKGIVKLAGDLGGTADAPTVPGLATKQNLLTNPITGTGTVNFISKFNGTTTLTNSQLFDNGTNIGIGTSTPSTKLEISSGTSGVSGLRFTNLTSAATPIAGTRFLSVDASGNVIYATTGLTLPLITANGTNSATTEVRDYNVWANRGNGFYLTDNGGAIANQIPNNPGWFSLSQVANGSNFFGQTALNDQGFWFRGGGTSTIASNTWLRALSVNANSRFAAQWDNTTNNSITLNNVDNGPLAFATNNAERMRILATGNVGIGTSIPTAQLEVATNNELSTIIRRGGVTSLTPANLILQKTMGADAATHGAVTNGNFIGRVLFSASNGSAYPTNGADMVGYAAGNQSTTNNGAGIMFRTSLQGAALQSVERMRIEHNGNVGIGTTNPTTNLDVVGGMSLRNVMGAAGSNFGIEFNTNSSSPRIDWVYNGAYTGSFVGDADNFFRLQNSRLGSGGFRFMTNPSGTAVERFTILHNGNIGISNTNPTQRLTITGTNNQPASSGSTSNATVRIDGSSNHALDIGAYANSPFGSYVQSVDKSNLATPLPLNLNPVAGNVGIGTSNPTSRLEVNGAATNTTAFNAAAGTSIDFSRSNLAYTTSSAGAFTLTNMKDGGTYTLAVQGTTSGTASFTGGGFTYRTINNGPTTAGRQTLYTFIVMGTTVYVYMATGFN